MNTIFFSFQNILLFLILAFMYMNCNKQIISDPTFPNTAEPVERSNINDIPIQSMKFSSGSVDYKLLLDKDEIVVVLFYLKKGETIPAHYHKVNKAIYIYEGQAQVFVKNKMDTVLEGDTLFVPKNSVTSVKNTTDKITRVFLFFPIGLFQTLTFNLPQKNGLDTLGAKISLLKEEHIPWENWDGKLPKGKITPLAWKTIIDNDSMVLGITKIDPGHDVDSHFHKPTQIVIFSDGEGKTHIQNGEYKEVVKDSFIYPPSYTVHHSINTHKTKPLMEVYFFPTGPFSTIKYLGKGKKYW